MRRIFAAACLAVAACAPLAEEADGTSVAAAETSARFYGDDRVGDRLGGATPACKVPRNFAEVEECFGVGRRCARADSQEVYVIEEKQARALDRPAVASEELFPRAVVTGCSTGDQSDNRAVEASFSLMVGLFSPPDATDTKDPISTTPVEVMAFDRTTRVFNFYVFSAEGVTRIFRDGERVMESTPTTAPRRADGARCFGCHVNGAPIMNELTSPWTNWVSQAKAFPTNTKLTGTTQALVSLATPSSTRRTASLAGALETTMRAAFDAFVSGYGPKTGTARLLRSVLCETELNYASAAETLPMATLWDPSVSSTLPRVDLDGEADFAFQVPVRSEVDRRVELYLVERGVLTRELVQALRLVDDENDVFSDARCALHATITAGELSAENAAERLRTALGALEPAWAKTEPARRAYLDALVTADAARSSGRAMDAAAVEAARGAYAREVATRHAALRRSFADGGEARDAVARKIAARKRRARELLGEGGPVPVLEPPAR